MKNIIVISILAATIAGCANTKSTTSKSYISNNENKILLTIKKDSGVSVPNNQYQLLENKIKEGLSNNGLLASSEENAKHLAAVNLHSFRMREDAARLTVGALSGCDNIKSTIIVSEKTTQHELGKSTISIRECAAWGVASQVINKYAEGVVTYLSGENR